MNYQAILHIPLSNYAHGLDENTVVFRLRGGKNELASCKLCYGDRACRINPVVFTCELMKKVASDLYFDYYEIVLSTPYTRICYYFELNDDKKTVYFYDNRFADYVPVERSEVFQFPFNHKNNIANVPTWFKDAIVYNIFPDSFASDKNYISEKKKAMEIDGITFDSISGGTIKGIESNIDYFLELGVNCIYMNPIFKAKEWHKYDTVDYYSIDPCFGTNDDFKSLVNTCHKNKIKVIIDGVFNHCGHHFFAFKDVIKNGKSSIYKDWFYGLKFPVIYPKNQDDIPTYSCFAYERKMPKMDTTNKELREYFLDVGKYWVREFDIDGWRLDVANEVDDEFWVDFRKAIKEEKKGCVIIGEVWETAYNWLRGDKYDSSMNYNMRVHCRDFFALGRINAEEFDARVTEMRMRYYKQMTYSQLNLLDSHDVPRYLSLCNGNVDKYALSVVFMMSFLGAPMVFYGDERGVKGVKESEYRQPMPWEKEKDEIFILYKKLIGIRNTYVALRRGEFRTLFAKSGLYAYEREFEDEKILVILNSSDEIYDMNKLNFISAHSNREVLISSFSGEKICKNDYCIVKIINH